MQGDIQLSFLVAPSSPPSPWGLRYDFGVSGNLET
jgi:hypothetical protein